MLNWTRPGLTGRVQAEGWPWPWLGAALFLVAVAVAYSFTLASLVDLLRLDTPIAYLPLLPIFAVGSACLIVSRASKYPRGDTGRELDMLLAAPLLLVALFLITVVPVFWSTLYWIDRLDVLSLAVFVTAGVTLLYGLSWTWRLRTPLLLLFLMWPAIYMRALPEVMQVTTAATNDALGLLVTVFPMGVTESADPSLLLVHTREPAPILVSVGSACSGANSLVGFALVGGVTSTLLTGGQVRKLAWLLVGAAIAFVANLFRLTSILLVASAGYPDLALGAYHAVIGLVLFTVVVVAALAMLPLFGLEIRFQGVDQLVSTPMAATPSATRRRLWKRAARLSCLAMTLVLAGFADKTLTVYSEWLTPSGLPHALPFGAQALPDGWRLEHLQDYPWAVREFGAGSSFDRFAIIADQQLVVADVIRTPDAAALSTYNLAACFLYHSYQIQTWQRVDLGHGVTAQLLDYYDPSSGKHVASMSWIWPVQYHGGTSYERVALSSDPLWGSGAAPELKPASGWRSVVLTLTQLFIGASSRQDKTLESANARVTWLALQLVAATASAAPNSLGHLP